MARDNLMLVGDEGAEEEIEAAFDVKFTEAELVSMSTVGDLHEALVARIPGGPGKCDTSMAFYRLRRGLKSIGETEPLRPGTSMPPGLVERPRSSLAQLSRLTGLRMPPVLVGPLGMGGCLVGLVALALSAVLSQQTPVGAVLLVMGAVGLMVISSRLDPGRLPKEIRTIGDLARRTAPLNYGSLVALGARSSDELAWIVLTEVLADIAEVPASEIGRDTKVYDGQKAAA